ncbi:MAG: alpha-glucosidase AglA [Thermomicrobiales bacterium]
MDTMQTNTTSDAADVAMPFSLVPLHQASWARRTPVKIGIIGAGSAQFSLNVVRDLCLTPGLAGSQVCFMDIDANRLAAIERLARRYAAEVGADLRFESTLDRETVLQDTDFVLNTAAQPHGDEEQQRSMWERHGYYRGVRLPYLNLELMLGVARDMERICPDAWLVQSGNPVFEGCTLMTRETGIKVVGLCHGHYGYRKIARILELEERDIAFEAPGVNHCIWMTQFRYRGEDAYPLIDDWIAQNAADYWKTPVTRFSDTQLSRAAVDMYRMFGLFPIGDTPRFGGFQYLSSWWYHHDLATKQRWYGELGGFDSEIGWSSYLAKMNENLARIQAATANEYDKLTDAFPPEHSGEQIVPIMDALVNDRQGIFQVNVPNDGALAGIADDVVVEVPALVGRDGIKPMRTSPLPRRLMNRALIPKILEMEMNLDIFLTDDPNAWFHQILLDHRTRSPEQAIAAMQAVLDLPFNARLRERFGDLTGLMALAGKEEEVLVAH